MSKKTLKKATKKSHKKPLKTARKSAKKATRKTGGPVGHNDPTDADQFNRETVVSFVLDETSSMASCKQGTITGFNEYIKTLQAKDGSDKILFTLTRFNTDAVLVNPKNARISTVQMLDDKSYRPAACTNLYDAIGKTINEIATSIKDAKMPPAVLVVIMTDGEENSSKEFNRDGIFKLIDEKKKDGWTFAFLGANQDAFQTGMSIGIARGNNMNYTSDNGGTINAHRAVADATMSYLKSGSVQCSNFFAGDVTVVDNDADTLPQAAHNTNFDSKFLTDKVKK